MRRRRATHQQEADDETEQADGGRKNLNDEDLHEQRGVVRVRERGTAARDADGDAAEQVGQADSQAGPEQAVACSAPAAPRGSTAQKAGRISATTAPRLGAPEQFGGHGRAPVK